MNRLLAFLVVPVFVTATAVAQTGPINPNPNAARDKHLLAARGDVKHLPNALKHVMLEMAVRPHTFLPAQVYGEAGSPSLLFQYFLLDSNGFEPNVFTAKIPGINDQAEDTATGANNLPAIGTVRLVVEPKPGLPVDPNDPGAFIDIFTDISGLFVINNESGWYEGWMIHDLVVAPVAMLNPDGHPAFGTITAEDAAALATMGNGQNVPGHTFTMDGFAARLPSADDHFPDKQTNLVPIQLSMGAYNSYQQGDPHSYWEFNYNTNWVHPLYELPFTGGSETQFEAGLVGALSSLVPGSGPSGIANSPVAYGDNPNVPRDPDRVEADVESQREFRVRFIPSGLANEVFLDVFERRVSFEPGINALQRLNDAYAYEVGRVDQDGDGVISFSEGDIDNKTDGLPNTRLFLPATSYNRFAVSREINDGYIAPRFAPSQRAWVLTGQRVLVDPVVIASAGLAGDEK